jgi:hypothetical protein
LKNPILKSVRAYPVKPFPKRSIFEEIKREVEVIKRGVEDVDVDEVVENNVRDGDNKKKCFLLVRGSLRRAGFRGFR